MSIEAVKKLAESWLAEAKSLDENAGITQQWSGVSLTDNVIANRKAVARQLMEQANAVLAALGKPCEQPSADELTGSTTDGERLRILVDGLRIFKTHTPLHSMDQAVQVAFGVAAAQFLAPYIARITELEASVRTENEFYKQSVHREGELRGMLETVLAR